MSDMRDDWEAPHCVKVSPAGVAWDPRNARVSIATKGPPTDDQPPPRQEGEAVGTPCFRQLWDRAGDRERAREQLDAWQLWGVPAAPIHAADHHLPWFITDIVIIAIKTTNMDYYSRFLDAVSSLICCWWRNSKWITSESITIIVSDCLNIVNIATLSTLLMLGRTLRTGIHISAEALQKFWRFTRSTFLF